MQKIMVEESELSFLETEEMEKIRLSLELSDVVKNKSILVTSSAEREGKTSVALKLGVALSASGNKVLYVSVNSNKILSQEIAPDIIYNTSKEKLDVISMDISADWQRVAEEYQYIIIDTPAMSVCKSNIAIADTCDMILFVIEANRLGYRQILESIEELSIGRCKNIRVILNRTKKTYSVFKKSIRR